MTTPDEGYLYVVASSRAHLLEAIQSATSCRRVDPRAHITIIVTPDVEAEARASLAFDGYVVRPAPPQGREQAWLFKAAVACEHSPYERTFLLDSDTWFVASCRDLFAMLRYFDLAMCPAPIDREPAMLDGEVIPAMTPFNSGVILFRRSDQVRSLFSAWAQRYQAHIHEMVTDQRAFVEALAQSSCRVFPLRNNVNARIPYPDKYLGEVRLLHGRHDDIASIARAINVTAASRIWMPGLETCLYSRMTLPALIALTLRAAARRWKRARSRVRRRDVAETMAGPGTRTIPAPAVA